MKKKPETLRKIGLIANFDKAASRAVVLRAAALIARTGRVAVLAEEQTARMAGLRCATFANPAALARQAGLLLVFGGDGTMLHVVHEIHGSRYPHSGHQHRPARIPDRGFLQRFARARSKKSGKTILSSSRAPSSRPPAMPGKPDPDMRASTTSSSATAPSRASSNWTSTSMTSP